MPFQLKLVKQRTLRKDVPFAIIASLLICTILYILVSLVLTGMMNYKDFDPLGQYPDAIKAPVAYAFDIAGQAWAGYIITIAATVGLISVLMVMIMGQSRIFLRNVKRWSYSSSILKN